jgi:hypothetical protein
MASVQLDLRHRRAGHCGSGALRDLLEFHGLAYGDEPASEALAFGLGAGLGFFYFELPQLEPPIYVVGRTAGLERDFCTHAGVELDLRRTDDPDEGWVWLRDELDGGRPTMVNADIKELPYLRVRMHNTMHDIVVTGYDPEAGVAYVADNDRDEIQVCPLDALARARNSHAFPAPNRHATWVMRFPDRLPAPEHAVRGAVAGAVANMREGGTPLDGGAQQPGLSGVDAFAAAYPGWPDLFGDRLAAAMRGLRVFIVKAGTGGAMFRSLHAGFLHEAAALLSDERLAQAARLYDELTDEWLALARACASEEADAHAAGVDHVSSIARLEHAGVAAMEAWLGV